MTSLGFRRACRRSPSACRRRASASCLQAIKKSGVPRASARPDGDLGRRPSLLLSLQFQEMGLRGGAGVEDGASHSSLRGRQADRRARNATSSSSAFSTGCRKTRNGPAARRDRARRQDVEQGIQGRCLPPGRAATSSDRQTPSTMTCRISPDTRASADHASATPIGPLDRAAHGRPGTVMVAVGAGHLAGAGSVIDHAQDRTASRSAACNEAHCSCPRCSSRDKCSPLAAFR